MNYTHNIRNIFFLSLTFFISIRALAQKDSEMSFFLTSLKQNALDSTSKEKRYYQNGALKEKTTVMHSHYYTFDIQKEKFLRKTFIKVKEMYTKSGVLVRTDSLAPPEQGLYFEKFFDENGKKKKVITYEFKGTYQLSIKPDKIIFLPKDYEKCSEYSIDKNGNRRSRYVKITLLRYVVHQLGDLYDITDRIFEGEYRDYPSNRYAIFEPKKNYLEIKITNPSNDSILCTLKYKYTNGFLNSTNPDEIRDFIIKNARVYVTTPRIVLYDQQTKKNFILDYNFERILKEPVKSCILLTRASTRTNYYWICNEKCGLYNLNGKNIISMEYGPHISGKGDYLKVSMNGHYSCIDYQGNVIIPSRSDIEDFTLYSDNVASIYTKGFSAKGKYQYYLDLHTRDTILTYEENINAFNSTIEWKKIKSSELLNDFEVIQDTLVFLELKNPKHYGITGADRRFWWQKYVLKLPDSLQKKTDLLTRYPDFDSVEYKYVLYNLKKRRGDTINVVLKALDGNPAYSISIDNHSFVNGYARLEIMVENSYQKFYSLLFYTGEIINIQRRYTKIGDVNDHGQAIVQFKEWKGTAKDGRNVETYGVVNVNGEEILPCQYSSCSLVKKYGYKVFTKDAKWGLIDFDGEILVKPDVTYDTIDSMIRESENPFIYSLTIDFN
jgi:hypothetical protein